MPLKVKTKNPLALQRKGCFWVKRLEENKILAVVASGKGVCDVVQKLLRKKEVLNSWGRKNGQESLPRGGTAGAGLREVQP